MERYTKIEISVGAFVLAGSLALGYLAFTLGGLEWNKPRYELKARFSSVGELKAGAPVKLAGVVIGEVRHIALSNFDGEAELLIDSTLKLPDDTMASIDSAGLLGDAYVSLSPGGSERTLVKGARIIRTEPAISLTELLSKYAFGSPLGTGSSESKPAGAKDELE